MYSSMECEATFVGLTTEKYNYQRYKSAIILYQKTETTFLFYLIGFIRHLCMILGGIDILTTIFYSNGASALFMNESYYPGSMRIGIIQVFLTRYSRLN